MTTPREIGQRIPDMTLRMMVKEVLAWRSTGTLTGEELRGLAEQLVGEAQMDERDSLSHAETVVLLEAAARYVSAEKSR